jgi:hypothetical protein
MRIEDKLLLTERDRVPSGSLYNDDISIRRRPVSELILCLAQDGIEIDPTKSEQHVEYRVGGSSEAKRSSAPLEATFPDSTRVIGYSLGGERFVIGLEEYHERGSSGDRIGQMVSSEDGVRCTFEFNGSYEEGRVAMETWSRARGVLSSFYVYGGTPVLGMGGGLGFREIGPRMEVKPT